MVWVGWSDSDVLSYNTIHTSGPYEIIWSICYVDWRFRLKFIQKNHRKKCRLVLISNRTFPFEDLFRLELVVKLTIKLIAIFFNVSRFSTQPGKEIDLTARKTSGKLCSDYLKVMLQIQRVINYCIDEIPFEDSLWISFAFEIFAMFRFSSRLRDSSSKLELRSVWMMSHKCITRVFDESSK